MFLRRPSLNQYRYFWRKQIWNFSKDSSIFVEKLRNHRLILFAMSIVSTTSLFLTRRAIRCEENAMSEIELADKLYKENQFKELYQFLQPFKDSTNPEFLWRIVRVHRKLAAMEETNKEEKKKLLSEGLELSTRSLEFGDDDCLCHKWHGAMLKDSWVWQKSRQVAVDMAWKERAHMEKSIELCPTDPESYHLMGIWCYDLADLTLLQIHLAKVLRLHIPRSTYQEALEYFLKAEELDPEPKAANRYMIGESYFKMGKEEEAKIWFQKTLECKGELQEDLQNKKKAEDKLKNLSLST